MERDAHYYEEKAEEFKLAGDAEGVAAALYQAAVHDRYLRSQRQHYSGYLFALHYLEEIGAEDLRAAHLAYGELYAEEEILPPVKAYQHEKVRIGYLSPRLVENSVMRFAEPLLLDLDRDEFEVFAFSLGEEEDEATERIRAALNEQGAGKHYLCLYGLSIEEGARAIREQEIDILFDLGGHSEGGQTLMIMAKKPAPVQLSGLGYFDTLGLPEGIVDGFLADEVLLPLGEEKKFLEPLFRLPQAFAFQPTAAMRNFRAGLAPRRAQGEVVFGVVQNVLKITDSALRAWGRILQEVPDSRLLIKDVLPASERLQHLRQRAERLGLPLERLELRGGSLSFWDIYQEVD
ncbi:MAG: glycosyl transferase family 41, partial [Selenomonas sp.]|nr:glycosyl transferase family 41 [Selenomonas sp.]